VRDGDGAAIVALAIPVRQHCVPVRVIELADHTLYGARRLGRNRVGQRVACGLADALGLPTIDGPTTDMEAFGVAHRHARSQQLGGTARCTA